MINNIFYKNCDYIDLHGYDMESARVVTNDFINDSVTLGRNTVLIIHGRGSGLVKRSVYDVLSKNKYVLDYKIDIFNEGVTIVNLKKLK